MDEYYPLFKKMCYSMNMDKETEFNAWQIVMDASEIGTLEGNPCHWFCCAFFAASCYKRLARRKYVVQEVNNCVSVNLLLRTSEISIFEFTAKMTTLSEIIKLPPSFLMRIKDMERRLSVTYTVFHRFRAIFEELFAPLPTEDVRNLKITRNNMHRYTPKKIFEFCWTLFLAVKNRRWSDRPQDLSTSLHLMFCTIDLVYRNTLQEQRNDLINTKSKGLPKNWKTSLFKRETIKDLSIINFMCELTVGIAEEAELLKKTIFRDSIEQLIKDNYIVCKADTYLEMFAALNFERNIKSLNTNYEKHVLFHTELDERVFTTCGPLTPLKDEYGIFTLPSMRLNTGQRNTPYTRQEMLPMRLNNNRELVLNATNNLRHLLDLAHIKDFGLNMKRYGVELTNTITAQLAEMESMFFKNYTRDSEGIQRFELAKSLFYYLSESIVRHELTLKPSNDLKNLLMQRDFNITMMTCCMEIILEAYNAQMRFPWTLNCFGIDAFDFYRIIEPIVLNNNNKITRPLIKHLNYIEETCLESLAWKKDSKLWLAFKDFPNRLPAWFEVDGKRDVTNASKAAAAAAPTASSSSTAASSSTATAAPTTPASSTATAAAVNTVDNKNSNKNTISPPKISALKSDGNAGTAAATATCVASTSTSAATSASPSTANSTVIPNKPAEQQKEAKPVMTKKLEVFLRKFYKLAWVRINKLCNELDMREKLVQRRIWTLFEYSISEKTTLMLDRHLDQLIMCAIYIYIRVSQIEGKTFTDIMKFYRKQPQATSSIYREVLINTPEDGGSKEYRDIIHFYNNVYVHDMTEFALNFNEKKQSMRDFLLSPHPTEQHIYPKKLFETQRIYVSPMEKNAVFPSPRQLTYDFGKGQSAELQRMNERINGKRWQSNVSSEEDADDMGNVEDVEEVEDVEMVAADVEVTEKHSDASPPHKRARLAATTTSDSSPKTDAALSANNRIILQVLNEREEQVAEEESPLTAEQLKEAAAMEGVLEIVNDDDDDDNELIVLKNVVVEVDSDIVLDDSLQVVDDDDDDDDNDNDNDNKDDNVASYVGHDSSNDDLVYEAQPKKSNS